MKIMLLEKKKKNFKEVLLVIFSFLFFLVLIFKFGFSWREVDAVSESDCLNSTSLSPGDIDECVNVVLPRIISAYAPAQEKNKQDLANLRRQLNDIDRQIASIKNQLKKTESEMETREEELAYTKKIFEEKTVNQYKSLRLYDPILPFLSSDNASTAFRELTFRQKTADEDRKIMEQYADDLLELKEDKETLEKNKTSLAALQQQVSEKEKVLAESVEEVENYISSLTAKQNELIALKAGGFSTSVGDTPATLEPCSGPPGSSNYCDPGFRPAFAAFSFGAPHRTGMSQYGAYGRSKSGQNAETILAAYFQGTSLNKSYSVPGSIYVTGYGSIPFEDNYLLGIYEVPESWGDNGGFEALKAQAIAARTYALAVTNNGVTSICATESCQVYKSQLKTGKWAEAVRATRGWVLMKDGSPAKTYYASTAGGYTISQWGWTGIKDTSGDWPSTAYEKVAGSPWFYKGWYKSRSGASCGRSNPWLTSTEMADILNAYEVLYHGVGDSSRVSPIDTDCWGGNPYSISELASIGGFSSVSSVSIVYNNGGYTQTVSFSTNKGSVTLSGEEFKKAFNLRAPGYIGLKSTLFNIEKL